MIAPPVRVAMALVAAATLVGCGPDPQASAATVPNVVGQALDAAKTTLLAAGFAAASQDLLRGRNPLLDSSWTVCTQTPGPVTAAQGTTVDLGVVKKAETCPDPTTTAAPPTPAATRTVAAPTRTLAVAPAAGNPTPRAAPKPRPAPTPVPEDKRAGGSGPAASTVSSGAFCNPPGTGVSRTGKPMVCAPAADGRNRWQSG
jgi:beta-lactam-binding protein with PASTA domain